MNNLNYFKRFYKWPVRISDIRKSGDAGIDSNKIHKVKGWVRNIRIQKNVSFIEVNDGSSVQGLQIVGDKDTFSNIKHGSAVEAEGNLMKGEGKNPQVEMQLKNIKLIGDCPNEFPLQPKHHTFEFLREIAHLRSRGNTAGALFRMRNESTQLIHQYFNKNGFINVHTPIITASDCEGGGEQFQVVSTLDNKSNKQPHFFGEPAYLTVSGQLEAEIFASSHSRVYTFGPTFRAEKSNTPRHLSEFWMIEPEIAFIDLNDNLDIAEDFLKYVINNLLINCKDDIEFFNKRIDTGLIERLKKTVDNKFIRLEYKDAINLLKESKEITQNSIEMGDDLQREHEKYITQHFGNVPVFIINWPKSIKPFYMRQDDSNPNVVSNMDLLVPEVGELIGGSIREERYDILLKNIQDLGMDQKTYEWYLDLRKYGSVPHGGFGLGFERFLQYVTGLQNIRDVIPIPRYQNYCKF
ncbi:hypothetical protein DICPUDRAFT_150804 [Dictyostelium purpureum]|uniref:asparagine--tRNA ligase n=1 Tax=Dictyostelium purpureum TaxID=5786 RepID=F0ZHA5_DICPU|nr:uncharacterized protein DICPUDRAFT_150804 [Dictyostelium purpureum]EGC36702.1 hypothetical protein DICPUDRAFT_150804 [Dictyostelium purpureum]|eukprot:XP_003286801.1 hypothetical protein DICPUDRAFT_150804 [Dictyostelium purpureum]